MCPVCRSTAVAWEPTSGRGTIWSFIVPHPPLLPAYAALAPYNVVVVALEERPSIRFVGNLLASPDGPINEVDPATIRIGEPVRVVFQQVEDVTLPRWVRR
jgi:Predicted nucleic-acid-binding protein containing a Zn-ribbon